MLRDVATLVMLDAILRAHRGELIARKWTDVSRRSAAIA